MSQDTNLVLPQDCIVHNDGSGPTSRSSVTHVAYVVSKFNELKRDLVRQIGFGGILELPQITKVDRKFTLWLLTNLDTEKRAIIVNDQCVTDIVDFEVSRIMGIPCGSRRVCALDSPDRKSKIEFIRNFIGSTGSDSNSLVAAESNVTSNYGIPMTLKEQDNFKISFVVWVMGHLLAPTKKHNFGGDRFWGGLLSPEDISEFNWAQFVLEELCIAAKDVQTSIMHKKPIKTICGCSILLQVLYFEAINMGTLNRPRGTVPRIKVYDSKALSLMIADDKTYSACASVFLLPNNLADGVVSDNGVQEELITNLGQFIRGTFGDQVSPQQLVALNWFHARCIQRCQQMRLRLQQDTIALVAKLFSKPDMSTSLVPPPHVHINVQASKANSEPSRPPMLHKRMHHLKRGSGSYGSLKSRHVTKKQLISSSQFELPETLLSGMSWSDDHKVRDELSDTEHQSSFTSDDYPFDMPITDLNNAAASFSENVFIPQGDLHPTPDLKGKTPVDITATNPICNSNIDVASSSGLKATCGHSSPPHIEVNLLLSTPPSAGGASDVPLFDLGIEPHTETEYHGNSNHHSEFVIETKPINPTVLNSITYDHRGADINIGYDGSCPQLGSLYPLSSAPASPKVVSPNKLTTPDNLIKSSSRSPASLAKIMAEGDLVERITRLDDSPNMNMKPWDEDFISSPIVKRKVDAGRITQSPWMYNYSHRSPPRDIVDNLFKDVSLTTLCLQNSVWLSHSCPRHIELDGTYIHGSFVTHKAFSYDLFDLAIRRLKQLDDMMYPEPSFPHWRHIIESEFAMLALAGEPAYSRKSIMEQFIGPSIKYRIQDCHMIVVPAFLLLNWCCYFFDLKNKLVHVVDPLYRKDKGDLFQQLHHPSISKIAACLDNCFFMFFLDWQPEMLSWDVVFVEPSIEDASPDETGLITLFNIRQFDGVKCNFVNRESFLYFKKVMLYELLCLADNHSKAPVNITISMMIRLSPFSAGLARVLPFE